MTMPGLGLGGSLSTLGLQPTPTITFSFSGDLVDSVGVSPALTTTMGAPLEDAMNMADYDFDTGLTTLTYVQRGYGVNEGIQVDSGHLSVIKRFTEIDAFGIGMTPTLIAKPGAIIHEVIRLQESIDPKLRYTWTVAEQIHMAQALGAAMPVLLSAGIGVHPAQTVSLAVTVLQGLGIAATPLPTLTYTQTLVQGFGVSDSFRNFFGGRLSDGVGVTATLAKQFRAQPNLADGVGITPTLSQHFYIRVTLEDEVGFDDSNILHMVYNGHLADGIEITVGYVSPDGNFSTWAVNTRSGAVTEYTNYAFNSFAKLGDKYIGASADGLFELLGDDDDGTDIVSTIRSGFAQWTSTRLSSITAAYLAIRGEGDFLLKIITGDGTTYNYAVNAQDMKTTKIRVGKGLRSRYFAFELISTGQDFDLDTLEFVPLTADRRV